jgi:Ca2+-binding RTX toxin-like protein
MSTIHGSGRRPLRAMAVAIGLTAALTAASPAGAAVTCSYDGGFNVVSIELGATSDEAHVHVAAGGVITVRSHSDPDVPCPGTGGPPRVTNTDIVSVSDNSDDPTTPASADGNTQLHIRDPIDFRPGVDVEPGDPEIEFQADPGAGLDRLQVTSTERPTANDEWILGTAGINWNANADGPADDADIAVAGFNLVMLELGPGNDRASAQGGSGTGAPFDGPGLLSMHGDAGGDQLMGGNGADTLFGFDGRDDLRGGPGADRLNGGADDDSMFGGAGADFVDFIGAPAGVTVDLSRTDAQDTGDGSDRLAEFERLRGSYRDDTLLGDAGENQLRGDEGDDTLDGGAGADNLNGGAGTDTVTYAREPAGVTANLAGAVGGLDILAEFENLVGSPFEDSLTGDNGANTITGLGGVDKISATGGADIVNARDGGPDTVFCGSQEDSALADRRSVDASIDDDCETVDFLPDPPTTPPGGAGAPDTAISAVLRGARSQRVLKQNGVIVKLSCPQEDCTARARATGRIPRRGRTPRSLALKALTRTIPGGETRTLKLRLAKRQRRIVRAALAAGKRPRLSVTVRVTDAAGNAAIRRLTVKVTP